MEINAFMDKYSFPLDPFQEEALKHLSAGLSVLVAAPTGSGKTVIAEYASELARESGKKFFYTTPLKALSNQKYRDLTRAFPPGHVGLLTGDNSINGDAPVVVMTTEVLRNMIYEKSELLDDLAYAVLDEVHYMHDPFRGAVWEEIVILLPSHVKLVALSATVSNAVELAAWMDSLRGDMRVVVSGERPVKLQNYYFVGRALVPLFQKNLPRIINEQLELLKKTQAAAQPRRGRRRGPDLRPRRNDVIRELAKRDMLPTLYFLFSRAACDDSVGRWLEKGERLTTPVQAAAIRDYLDEKAAALEPADLECLDYKRFRDALSAGVASHHAGALPLFKEAVEELFTAGYIKVVFATETLSLGINMPARSAVIESLTKWTGEKQRPLTPGEYKQLTGRAGRRGIDEVGYAVVLYQTFFSLDHVRSLVTREPNPVVSSFQVTYNMAANILADHSMEEAQKILNLSFAQYVADRRVVTVEARMQSLREDLARELEASRCEEGGDASTYREIERDAAGLQRKLASLRKERKHHDIREAVARLQPGDVFLGGHHEQGKVLAVVKRPKERKQEPALTVVDSLGRYRRLNARSFTRPPRVIGAVDIGKVTSPTRKVRRAVGARMETLGKEAASQQEQPAARAEEEALSVAIEGLKQRRLAHSCDKCAHRDRCLEAARRAEKAERSMHAATRERDSGHDVVSRRLADVVAVLDRFGFLEEGRPSAKGEMLRRVYNECDLLLAEALWRGTLSRLEPRELATLGAWFIYESRDGESAGAHLEAAEQDYLQGPLGEVLAELATMESEMKQAESERGLDLLGSLDTGFGEAAYLWAGETELEDMLARFPGKSVGDMVRTMKQIIDLLRQLADVAEDPVLLRNLRRAMDAIDRGVVGYSSIESIIEMEMRGEGDGG